MSGSCFKVSSKPKSWGREWKRHDGVNVIHIEGGEGIVTRGFMIPADLKVPFPDQQTAGPGDSNKLLILRLGQETSDLKKNKKCLRRVAQQSVF